MDPITLSILAALAAGVAEGLGATAYNALKDALKKKHGPNSGLVEAVEKLEQRPDSAGWKEEVATQVQAAKADQDPELLKLAEALKAALDKTTKGKAALSKYNIHATNSDIGVIGDNAQIKDGIHFGDKK